MKPVTRILKTGAPFRTSDIRTLLEVSDKDELELLFQTARSVRERFFGNRIFLYGFLYFSTFCRNNCTFCQYRSANQTITRYRKTSDQILAAAEEMTASGVHLIDLTMGEDPALYDRGGAAFKQWVSMLRSIRTATRLPVMISPGVVPEPVLCDLASAGMTWYACYQETHNEQLYQTLRPGQDFRERISRKQSAKKLGMLIEEGILTGVGETTQDLAESISFMKAFSVDQARVMTFVPQPGTPMAGKPPQDSLKEQVIIAVMRIVLKDVLIPASLDVGGLSGLSARLNAGANVVTSIVPPQKGLAGVANPVLDIEEARRSLSHILPVIDDCRLAPASHREYNNWIEKRQAALNQIILETI